MFIGRLNNDANPRFKLQFEKTCATLSSKFTQVIVAKTENTDKFNNLAWDLGKLQTKISEPEQSHIYKNGQDRELIRFSSYRACLISRKWAEVRNGKCHFPLPLSIQTLKKKNRKFLFLFSFPFTQPFPHFQGATINFVVI